MSNPDSQRGYFNQEQREEELGDAERLLKSIFENLDPLSFTAEEILDYYTPPVTHDGQQEDANEADEKSVELLEQQLSALLTHGLIEQHGEVYKVTNEGEKYYEEMEAMVSETNEENFQDDF